MQHLSIRIRVVLWAVAFGVAVLGPGAGDGRGAPRAAADPVALELGTASIGLAFAGQMLAREASRFVDEAQPARDGDGQITADDRALGYRDGILDAGDRYAKIRGRLVLAVSRSAWENAHGESYQTVVNGAIRPEPGPTAVVFGAGARALPEITTAMFDGAEAWYEAQVPGGADDFEAQVAENVAGSGVYTPPGDNTWEPVPFGSPGAYDYYQRAVYEYMRFENVRIPMGNNGLFRNCLFVGVTFVETESDCFHENWNYAGAVERVEEYPPGSGNWIYEPKYPGVIAELSDGTPVPDTKVMSNNVRFDNCAFVGSLAGVTPGEFTHWRNHVQFTGETRFYADADDPDLADEPDEDLRDEIIGEILAWEDDVHDKLRRCPIMLPGWSVDLRCFDHPSGAPPVEVPAVKLKGTIVAGTLDVRGSAHLRGSVVVTFRPVADEGPLFYGGHPSVFTNTIGFLGVGEDVPPGDPYFPGFGAITLHHGFAAPLPAGMPWPRPPTRRVYLALGPIRARPAEERSGACTTATSTTTACSTSRRPSTRTTR